MKWKLIFKMQLVLLLIIGAIVFSPRVFAKGSPYPNLFENMGNAPIKISGKVTDSSGAGMPGVQVVVKGTATETITGNDGKYTLDVPDSKSFLVFSFVGYSTIEKQANQNPINVVLAEDVQKIEDVVVIGYGTQKKADLTCSVSTVAPEKLTQGVNQSISHTLQGQAAGVTVIQNSGEPGGSV